MNATPQQPTTHELKMWPRYYEALERGDKTFEVRCADRDFRPGDLLRLREWDPTRENFSCKDGRYTGREMTVCVGYVYSLGPEVSQARHVVMAINRAQPPQPTSERLIGGPDTFYPKAAQSTGVQQFSPYGRAGTFNETSPKAQPTGDVEGLVAEALAAIKDRLASADERDPRDSIALAKADTALRSADSRLAASVESQQILDGIAEILETHGWAHFANSGGIEKLLTTYERAEARVAELEKRLGEMVHAYDNGGVQIASPEIGGHDDIPPHPWHEEWMHGARAALSTEAKK